MLFHPVRGSCETQAALLRIIRAFITTVATIIETSAVKLTTAMAVNISNKHDFFSGLIRGIELEAQRSERAANEACSRVNYVRLVEAPR